MAGLLDQLFATPSDQALFALGSGLFGVRRGQEGQAFQGAMKAYNSAKEQEEVRKQREMQQRLLEMQIKQATQQASDGDILRGIYSNPANFMRSPQSAFPPNEMDAEGAPAAPPMFDQNLLAQNLLKSGTLAGAKEGMAMMAKDDKETVVAPGSTVLKNGRPIFTAPFKADLPPEIVRLAQIRDTLPPGHPMRKVLDDAITKQTTHAPAAVQNNFAGGEKGYKHSRDLASDFKAEPIYKAHMEVSSAYSQIKQGLASESPAGDLAAATKFMKLIDPNSVVRESELQMAMAASGLADRIANYVQMVMSGTKLTPAQRRDFRNMADRLYQESDKAYRAKHKHYQGIAKKYELDPSMLDLGAQPGRFMPESVDDLVNYYGAEEDR